MMSNEYEIFEFLEADNAETNTKRRRRRKILREKSNPFELPEAEFVKRYRLTKDLVFNLIDDLKPLMKAPLKSTDLTVETKVLTALSFYATGSYQRPIGDIEGQSMAQQTVSKIISQITASLNTSEIRKKYIVFPTSEQDRHRIRTEFYKKFGIPGVLGCIGCTHVAIIRPTIHEENFVCRKHHSLKIQLVCDANMQILSVDASHGGAIHEAAIWRDHPLRAHLDDLSNTENAWFLADSGYPLRKTMLTPILNAAPNTPEAHYNNLHVQARNTIKQTIGLLKARFRCLLAQRILHYSPEVAGSIVNACVILHNICNKVDTPVKQLSEEELTRESQLQHNDVCEQPHTPTNNTALQHGLDTRSSLVHQLWEKRHSRTSNVY